ncbi:PEGA domain-containing protein [Rubricoccus marinus]|uniref:Uncharacterized protein n=1 Tax=Rubricoccus marinus TaxID=716817 RepID=A0A259U180_9BACT|nr:PEGA domain-containing protein [Rubricoccus marinus]OZC03598.1 hypothetical protein BSZ36_11755 [Rubricoccus marinus]
MTVLALPRFALLACAALLAASAAAAQVALPAEGTVTLVGEQIEVDLDGAAEAAIGARLLTTRVVDIGGREVGVLTGVYRVVRVEWPRLRAIPDADASGDLPGADRGDRVALETPGDPSEIIIVSDPADARISWNGHLLGMTGDTLTVAPGPYSFTFERADYEPSTFDFEVPIGQIRQESISLDQAAGGDVLYNSAKAKFAACDFARARDLASEAISAGLSGEEQDEAFILFEAMRQIAPAAERARAQRAKESDVCDAGSALHLFVKAEAAGDGVTRNLACDDLRRALPDDPLVRQKCPG